MGEGVDGCAYVGDLVYWLHDAEKYPCFLKDSLILKETNHK